MTRNFKNGLLVAAVLATASPLVLTSTAFAKDPPTKEERAAAREKAKDARAEAQQAREEAQQARVQAQQARAPARDAHQQDAAQARERARANAMQAAQHRQQAELAAQQAAQRANQAARQENRAERQQAQVANQAARQENRAERQQAQVANQAARQDARADRQARRLSEAQQKALIATQQSRVNSYRAWTAAQRTQAARIAAAVQAQNRAQQYAYLQDYQNRLWSQQQRYATQSMNYYNDPYYYTAPSYRYMRDGSWYTINSYGYDLLQQAINEGYGEGYRAGRADRMDGWRFDYRSSWVYQNASYGYSGYYMDRTEYSYYFRQGFRRGYEDGYYSRYQYGSYRNGGYSILGAVLNTILNVQPYNYRY